MKDEDKSFRELLAEVSELRLQLELLAQHDESVQEQVARLKALVESAVEGIVTINESGLVETFNPAAEKLFGIAAEEIIGKKINCLMPEPFHSQHDQYLKNYLTSGTPKIIGIGREVLAKRYDGRTFPIYLSVGEMWVGERRLFAGIIRDITAYKQALAALEKSEKRYQDLLDSISDFIITHDMDGLLLSVNRAAVEVFGHSKAELIGRSLIDFLHPAAIEAFKAHYLHRLRDEGRYDGLAVFVNRDGQPRYIEFRSAVTDSGENGVYVSGVGRDVTARRKAEKEAIQARRAVELYARDLKESLEISESFREEMTEQLQTAAAIQRQLLPQNLPEIPGLRLAWEFQPSETLGGDMLGVFVLDEDRVIVYILDVSGHGVPSALLTFAMSQTLSPHGDVVRECGLASDSPAPVFRWPAAVLTELDQQYPLERFNKTFTLIYLILDAKQGVLTYTNAGHPAGILIRTNGTIEYLDAGGPLIGLGGICPYDQAEVKLAPGDRVILYTDGVTEYQGADGSFYGEERLKKALLAANDLPLAETLQTIMADLEEFGQGYPPADDVMLAGFECTPAWGGHAR